MVTVRDCLCSFIQLSSFSLAGFSTTTLLAVLKVILELAVTRLFTQLLSFKEGLPLNSYAILTDSVKLSEIVAEATHNLLMVNSEPVLNSNCIYKLTDTVLS